MTQDEIIDMARHIAITIGSRMCDENGDTHGEELYCMDLDDIVYAIKLVAEKEQERCCSIVYGMAGSDNVAQRTVDAIRGKK